MPSHTIILAHGIFGFGALNAEIPLPLNYFNGVTDHLKQQGHTVFAPQVNPIGSVQQRGEQLKAAILKNIPLEGKVHILAHSMGGLDARYALAHYPELASRVSTLVTIGTPHRGSPVADAVAHPSDPLFKHIPPFLLQILQTNAGALHDLTTEAGSRFNESTPDAKGVRYLNVAGDASRGGYKLFLFKLASVIGDLTGQINDGVVARDSALLEGHEQLEDWPVDHAGEVGWEITFLPSAEHLARYDALVAQL
jgi:triacylglycerol lipase